MTRRFEPGTTGWTASDLDDPAIEREWFRGAYEIVEGVLTTMPPAYFAGGNATANLIVLLTAYSRKNRLRWKVATEADIEVDELRVPRADTVILTPKDIKRQDELAKGRGRADPRRVRLLVPPTLIIESISPGHELHDERTKKAWYAEFGVPHYWIANAYQQTLECFRLDGGKYRLDAKGKGHQIIKRVGFPGLAIPLKEIWDD